MWRTFRIQRAKGGLVPGLTCRHSAQYVSTVRTQTFSDPPWPGVWNSRTARRIRSDWRIPLITPLHTSLYIDGSLSNKTLNDPPTD